MSNVQIKAIVEAVEAALTDSELSAAFGVSDKTITVDLRQIGNKYASSAAFLTHSLQ